MGGFLGSVGEAVTRKKTVEPPAVGLKQQLTFLDLAAVGLSGVVGVGGYVYVGVGAAEWAGPSIVLSVLLAAVSALITGAVCSDLGVRMSRGGGIFTHVYVSLGELPAVLVASTLMLDLILVTAIAAKSSSEYLSAATNLSMNLSLLDLSLLQETRYLSPELDLLAANLVLVATLMVVAGTKLVCQVGAAGVGVSLLVLTGVSFTAFFVSADVENWTRPPGGFFPSGLHGVIGGAASLSVAVGGAHHAGLLSGECYGSSVAARVGVGVGASALLVLFPSAIAVTLASSTLTPTAPLTQLFPGESLAGMRALVGVGGVLGLAGATVGGLLAGSRLAHRLACDGLALKCLGRVAKNTTTTPWVSAIFCGSLAAFAAAVGSSWALVRAAGAGGVTAGVAGAAAVLASRYRPRDAHQTPESASRDTTPTTVDESDLYRVSVQWAGGRWASAIFEPPAPPTRASWRTSRFLMITYTANCLAGVGVVRGGKELDIGPWASWVGVCLCVCGCVVCGVGLWLQPRHPPQTPTHAHQEEEATTTPTLLPLLAILTNILLLLHLPPAALTAACGVWAAAAGVWFLHGRTSSLEAVLSRALLTHVGQESSPDLL